MRDAAYPNFSFCNNDTKEIVNVSWLLLLSMMSGIERTAASAALIEIREVNIQCRQIINCPYKTINIVDQRCNLQTSFLLGSSFDWVQLPFQIPQKSDLASAHKTHYLQNSPTWKMLQREFPVR
tara:strand:- start:4043 stop:4414 length:372 start_codon:yes stop_codon:yes gene_type:complete